MPEQRFRSKFAKSPAWILAIAMFFMMWITGSAADNSFELFLPSVLLVVPAVVLFCHPQGGSGALVVNEHGMRVEPLLGAQRFAQRLVWADVRSLELEQQGVQTMLRIVCHDCRVLHWPIEAYGPTGPIVAAIRTHFDFDPVVLQPNQGFGADIGQRPLYVIVLAFACLLLVLAIEHMGLRAWHTPSGFLFALFLVVMPFAIVASGLWIRRDRKAHPWLAAVFAGALAGIFLALALQSGNRLLTEAGWRTEERAEFRLESTGRYGQRWAPADPQAWPFDEGYFEISKGWPGYDARLEAGHSYRLTVWRGALNDIAFPLEAFSEAHRVE